MSDWLILPGWRSALIWLNVSLAAQNAGEFSLQHCFANQAFGNKSRLQQCIIDIEDTSGESHAID